MKRVYLTTEEVAKRYHQSVRSLHAETAAGRIPHRKLPGQRRCLFLEDELEAWEDGAALEVHELLDDAGELAGRIVRPVE